MRHLILALMIVLLPLRGWAGDSMAMQMASTAIAIESGAAYAHKMGVTDTFYQKKQAAHDCHEVLAGQPDSGEIASTAPGSDHCGTCQACQVCHTVALSLPSLAVTISFASPQLGQTSASTFTSADAALGQKPPIA